eukprot:CAMPEP_0114670394 /NCGR_PEP_ID=MMETSP0191-20121206/39463_1 /TAXON_ID=126664 /ORGANISM="Sorites sp." /LENGTH=192 /DNA_ID=CAMNT_0001927891 /DNA_START=376 /DNA_END=951 /DNA_ORIENTATION=+
MVHNGKPSANAAANGVVFIYYHASIVAANAQGFSSKGWIANSAIANAHAEAVVQPPKFTKHLVNAKAITNAGAGGVAHHSHPSPAVAPYVHSFSSKTWSADIANVNFLAKAVVQPPRFIEHLVTVHVGRSTGLCNVGRRQMNCTKYCRWHSTLLPQCLALDSKNGTSIGLRSRKAQAHAEDVVDPEGVSMGW